uniref:Putative secreted protein n=1 Tax=Anopheles darlingi TaxID=43151 RepID=A0A2M4D4R7_ANODA
MERATAAGDVSLSLVLPLVVALQRRKAVHLLATQLTLHRVKLLQSSVLLFERFLGSAHRWLSGFLLRSARQLTYHGAPSGPIFRWFVRRYRVILGILRFGVGPFIRIGAIGGFESLFSHFRVQKLLLVGGFLFNDQILAKNFFVTCVVERTTLDGLL